VPGFVISLRKWRQIVIKGKLSAELLVAIILSAAILLVMGGLSYASKNNFFLYVGIMTAFFGMSMAIASNRT